MFLIILGSLMSLAGLMGLLGSFLPTSTPTAGGYIGLAILLLAGTGLIVLGAKQRKRKKEELKLIQKPPIQPANETMIPPASFPGISPGTPDVTGLGLLVIDWDHKAMVSDTLITLYLDGTPIGVMSFKEDTRTSLAIPQGMHRCSTKVLGAPFIDIEVKAGQSCTLRLVYSRSSGRLKFENAGVSVPVSQVELGAAAAAFTRKLRLMEAGAALTAKGYPLFELTDDRAVIMLSHEVSALYFVVLFLLGILPAILYLIIRSRSAKLAVFEFQSDGSIGTRLIRGKDIRKLT